MPQTATRTKNTAIATVKNVVSVLPIPVNLDRKHIKFRDYEEVKKEIEKYITSIETPGIAGLAYSLGISRQMLYKYRKGGTGVSKDVSKLLNTAISYLEKSVEERLISGKLNPTAAIFWLCNVKNEDSWSNKHQMDHSGSMNININVNPFGKKAKQKSSKNIG